MDGCERHVRGWAISDLLSRSRVPPIPPSRWAWRCWLIQDAREEMECQGERVSVNPPSWWYWLRLWAYSRLERGEIDRWISQALQFLIVEDSEFQEGAWKPRRRSSRRSLLFLNIAQSMDIFTPSSKCIFRKVCNIIDFNIFRENCLYF